MKMKSAAAGCLSMMLAFFPGTVSAQEISAFEVPESSQPLLFESGTSQQEIRDRLNRSLAPYLRRDPALLESLGFFLYLQDLQAALLVAEGIEQGLVSLHDPSDCASLDNMRDSLFYIRQGNALRAAHQKEPLRIDPALMAVSILQTNAAGRIHQHSKLFRVAENLSWGTLPNRPLKDPFNPFTGWYDEEKNDYDADPNNPAAGHCRNLLSSQYGTTGFAIGQNAAPLEWMLPTVMGQTFEFQGHGAAGMTVDEYEQALNEFRSHFEDGTLEVCPPEAEIVYRLYNPQSGEHFYTCGRTERNTLRSLGWKYEGYGWFAPKSGDPVYRLYNPNSKDHHYTTNSKERETLMEAGWKDEGIGWHSAPANQGEALYRQYNPNAVVGSHNFTLSKNENDTLASSGWKAEGIAWYGLPVDFSF